MKTGSDFLRSVGIEGPARDHAIHADHERSGVGDEKAIGVGDWQPGGVGDDGAPAADAAAGQQGEEREAPSREVGLTHSGRSGDSGQFGQRTPPRARFAEFMANGLAAELPPTGNSPQLLAGPAATLPAWANTVALDADGALTDQLVSPGQLTAAELIGGAGAAEVLAYPVSAGARTAGDDASSIASSTAVVRAPTVSAPVDGDSVPPVAVPPAVPVDRSMAADGTRTHQERAPARSLGDSHFDARPSARPAVGLEVLRQMFANAGAALLGYASVEYDEGLAAEAAPAMPTQAPESGAGGAPAPGTANPQATSQRETAPLVIERAATMGGRATGSSIADPAVTMRVHGDSGGPQPLATTDDANVRTEARVSEVIQQLTTELPRSASVPGQVHRRRVAEQQQSGLEVAASLRSGPAVMDSATPPSPRMADGRAPILPSPEAAQSEWGAEHAPPPVVSELIDLSTGALGVGAVAAPDVSVSTATDRAGRPFAATPPATQLHGVAATVSSPTLAARASKEQSAALTQAGVVNERAVGSTDVRTPAIELAVALPAPSETTAAPAVLAADGAVSADPSDTPSTPGRPPAQQDAVASWHPLASQVASLAVHVPWSAPSGFASQTPLKAHARTDTRAFSSSAAGGAGEPGADDAQATGTGPSSILTPGAPATRAVPEPSSLPPVAPGAGSSATSEQAVAPASKPGLAPPSVAATAVATTTAKQPTSLASPHQVVQGSSVDALQPRGETGNLAAPPSRAAIDQGKQAAPGALPSPMVAAGRDPVPSPSGSPVLEQQGENEGPSGRSPVPKSVLTTGQLGEAPSVLLVDRPAVEPPLAPSTSAPVSRTMAGPRGVSAVQAGSVSRPSLDAPASPEATRPLETREKLQSPPAAGAVPAPAPDVPRGPRALRGAVPLPLPDAVPAVVAGAASASASPSAAALLSVQPVDPAPGIAATGAAVTPPAVGLASPNAPIAASRRARAEAPAEQQVATESPLAGPTNGGPAADVPAHPIAPGIPPVPTVQPVLVGRVADSSTHHSIAAAASLAVSSSDSPWSSAPTPASQPRRVRAAVLELQDQLTDRLRNRSLDFGNAAPAPVDSPTSRHGIDTAPSLDKGNQKKLPSPSSSAEEGPAPVAPAWALPMALASAAPFTTPGSPAAVNPSRRSTAARVDAVPEQLGGIAQHAPAAAASVIPVPQVALSGALGAPPSTLLPPVAATVAPVSSSLGSATTTPTGAAPAQHASLTSAASELLAAAALHLGTRAVAQPSSRAAVPALSSPPAHPPQAGQVLQTSPAGLFAQGDLSSRPASTSDPGLGSASSSASERKREQPPVGSQLDAPRAIPAPAERSVTDLQGMQMGAAPAAAAPPPLSDPRPTGSSATHAAAPAPAHPLLELAAADPSLNASALGKNAHVRLETKSDGDLSLHLMVHDGVVDVRFDGAAAHKLDLRPSEVRAALAGEGIAMGSFETARSSSSQALNQPSSTSNSGSQFGSGANSNSSSFQSNSDSPGNSGGGGGDASSAQTGTGAGTGSGFGGGARNPDGGDRWANSGPDAGSHRRSDGGSRPSPHATSNSSNADQPPRRRGFHVTA